MDPLDQGTPGRVPHAAAQRPHGPGTAEAEHAPRVVGAEHREELEALLDLMRMSVELDDRCGTGAGPGGASSNDATLRAHFAELHARLGEWDERVERVRAAPGALWGWFERSAPREGISEPPFAVGALIDRLAILTVQRARAGQLASPRELHVQHFTDRVAGGERVSVYVEGQNVAQLDGEPASTLRRRIEMTWELIQAFFDAAQSSAQAVAIGSARDALSDLKPPLLDHIAREAALETIAAARGCPACDALLGAGPAAPPPAAGTT